MADKSDVSSIQGRVDGKVCLVTGANSGLGKAISIELARRGANIIMGCRNHYVKEMNEIREKSGNPRVTLKQIDLSSIASVDRFCRELAGEGKHLDILLCNAGVVSLGKELSQDGYPLLLQVNFLAYARMLQNLLESGVVSLDNSGRHIPRIVFTSSSRHRGPLSVDFDRFCELPEMGIMDVLKLYGLSKLYLMTYAWELARRSMHEDKPGISIFAFCPGPFRSRIGKNFGFAGRLVMKLFPTSPAKAAWGPVYLACSPDLEGKTMVYYHKKQEEKPDERVVNLSNGLKIWEKTNDVLDQFDHVN